MGDLILSISHDSIFEVKYFDSQLPDPSSKGVWLFVPQSYDNQCQNYLSSLWVGIRSSSLNSYGIQSSSLNSYGIQSSRAIIRFKIPDVQLKPEFKDHPNYIPFDFSRILTYSSLSHRKYIQLSCPWEEFSPTLILPSNNS